MRRSIDGLMDRAPSEAEVAAIERTLAEAPPRDASRQAHHAPRARCTSPTSGWQSGEWTVAEAHAGGRCARGYRARATGTRSRPTSSPPAELRQGGGGLGPRARRRAIDERDPSRRCTCSSSKTTARSPRTFTSTPGGARPPVRLCRFRSGGCGLLACTAFDALVLDQQPARRRRFALHAGCVPRDAMPILVLTARDALEQAAFGFEAGGTLDQTVRRCRSSSPPAGTGAAQCRAAGRFRCCCHGALEFRPRPRSCACRAVFSPCRRSPCAWSPNCSPSPSACSRAASSEIAVWGHEQDSSDNLRSVLQTPAAHPRRRRITQVVNVHGLGYKARQPLTAARRRGAGVGCRTACDPYRGVGHGRAGRAHRRSRSPGAASTRRWRRVHRRHSRTAALLGIEHSRRLGTLIGPQTPNMTLYRFARWLPPARAEPRAALAGPWRWAITRNGPPGASCTFAVQRPMASATCSGTTNRTSQARVGRGRHGRDRRPGAERLVLSPRPAIAARLTRGWRRWLSASRRGDGTPSPRWTRGRASAWWRARWTGRGAPGRRAGARARFQRQSVARAAHPLAGIRSDAEMLLNDPVLSDKARRRAERIIATTDRHHHARPKPAAAFAREALAAGRSNQST